MDKELRSKESHIYELTGGNATCFIKGNINVDEMRGLIFFYLI